MRTRTDWPVMPLSSKRTDLSPLLNPRSLLTVHMIFSNVLPLPSVSLLQLTRPWVTTMSSLKELSWSQTWWPQDPMHQRLPPEVIAEHTVRALQRTVPAAVPAIVSCPVDRVKKRPMLTSMPPSKTPPPPQLLLLRCNTTVAPLTPLHSLKSPSHCFFFAQTQSWLKILSSICKEATPSWTSVQSTSSTTTLWRLFVTFLRFKSSPTTPSQHRCFTDHHHLRTHYPFQLLMFDFTIGSCNIHTLIRNFNCTCNLQLPFQMMLRSVTTINSKLQTQCKNIRYRFHATHVPPSLQTSISVIP